ncbi:MAG: GNAT family N-acetyltransferase [Candidatus Bathyarchaeota archaeon]|nr:GNAT family N-acetyltransferase [Candidatus Bathyarchaeota archaeon]
MEIEIGDASVQFLDELFAVEKQCFEQEAFSKSQIACLLTDCDSIGLAAWFGDELAGFIIGRVALKRRMLVGHILTVDVAPVFRRRGVGKQLMQGLEEAFGRCRVREVHLEVREDNVAALGLYQGLGYRRVARLENYYGAVHGLYFRKRLRV